MYYILNQHKQIIAADSDLLALCEAKHLDDLLLQIIQGETDFTEASQGHIAIKTAQGEDTFTVEKTILSSMLGEMTLITLSSSETNKEEEDTLSTLETTTEESIMNLASTSTTQESENVDEEMLEKLFEEDVLTEDITKENILKDSIEEESIDVASLLQTPLSTEETEETEETEHVETDLIDNEVTPEEDKENHTEETHTLEKISLLEDTEEKKEVEEETNTLEEISFLKDDNEESVSTQPHTLDIEKISHEIGISTEDYKLFFHEFIDTAFSLEKELRHPEEEAYKHAITTLSHLSDALHLFAVQKSIQEIDAAHDDTKIDALYHMLLELSEFDTISENKHPIEESENKDTEEPKIELFDDIPLINEEDTEEEVKEETKPSTTESFGSLNLDDVKPIHFDFKLEEAAEDLSLPVELIEEFVQDFIEQAHIETDKMLEAYKAGDLETIQKIGHLLKGASSNLRINTLSETLYKIQFCEDPNNLEELIKDYWGHFLAFEKQINIISNR